MTTARRRRPDPASRTRICNVVPSRDTDKDWRFEQSVDAGVLGAAGPLPREVDLREDWWAINNQEDTGSCVGWATADGVVRWHMVKAGKLRKTRMLSPRHVWMASKETDSITERPESFIEEAGTTLKAALDVARKHGVALEEDLPFHVGSKMYVGPEATFYARASRRKIASYFNLELNLTNWKTWLAEQGPILAALLVDASWDDADGQRRQDRHLRLLDRARRPRHRGGGLPPRRPVHRPQQLGHRLGRQRLRLRQARLRQGGLLRRVLRRQRVSLSLDPRGRRQSRSVTRRVSAASAECRQAGRRPARGADNAAGDDHGWWTAQQASTMRVDLSRLSRCGRRPRRCCRRGRGRRRRSSASWYSGHSRGSCRLSAPSSSAAAWKARTVSASGAAKATCISRLGPMPSKVEIQKAGWVGAVADGHTEVHHPSVAQHAEHLVVERGRRRHVGAVDAEVVDHGPILHPGADSRDRRALESAG